MKMLDRRGDDEGGGGGSYGGASRGSRESGRRRTRDDEECQGAMTEAGAVASWHRTLCLLPTAHDRPIRLNRTRPPPRTRVTFPDVPGERFNAITHLIGSVLALAGASVVITLAAQRGGATRITAVAIYGAMLFILYLSSTLYHSFRGRAKRVFHVFDHCSIYLLIAGTYTPFTLDHTARQMGLVDVRRDLDAGHRRRREGRAVPRPVSRRLGRALHPDGLDRRRRLHAAEARAASSRDIAWLLAGGLAYTVGVVFFAMSKKVAYTHGVWHLFVIAGSTCTTWQWSATSPCSGPPRETLRSLEPVEVVLQRPYEGLRRGRGQMSRRHDVMNRRRRHRRLVVAEIEEEAEVGAERRLRRRRDIPCSRRCYRACSHRRCSGSRRKMPRPLPNPGPLKLFRNGIRLHHEVGHVVVRD